MSRGAAGRLEALWAREGAGAALLTPLAWLYALGAGIRNAAYDLGLLSAIPLGAPTVSVGNLSVGGTGKTPVSAFIAGRLMTMGFRPGILLRGYGDDEPLVHRRLTPGAVVVADADRIAGAERAYAKGARAFVLDDAFQYRRAARDLDIVLVSAEQGHLTRRLPAGPLREGRSALLRADVLMVTRKSASLAVAEETARRWGWGVPDLATVVATLAPSALVPVDANAAVEPLPLAALRDARVLAISAIGDPDAFEAQLERHGARVSSGAFPDHHPFTDIEIAALARRAAESDLAVCTLKDAVKLEGRWPRQGPALWYLSQAVSIERGGAELDARLRGLAPAAES
jgi:tetraacyldisaccharide 4'-kinase